MSSSYRAVGLLPEFATALSAFSGSSENSRTRVALLRDLGRLSGLLGLATQYERLDSMNLSDARTQSYQSLCL